MRKTHTRQLRGIYRQKRENLFLNTTHDAKTMNGYHNTWEINKTKLSAKRMGYCPQIKSARRLKATATPTNHIYRKMTRLSNVWEMPILKRSAKKAHIALIDISSSVSITTSLRDKLLLSKKLKRWTELKEASK